MRFTHNHARSLIIIEEYIQGISLVEAGLSESSLLTAMKELCDVLGFLHKRGILHRDIKPSNILLANDGHIRLIDFDAARTVKEQMSRDTTLLGTRGYAPPEQYGFSQTDERADIYAFGITFRQLLEKSAHKKRYKKIIQKCTYLNPDERYSSMDQVKKALAFTYAKNLQILIATLLLILLLLFLTLRFMGRDTATQESLGDANPSSSSNASSAIVETAPEIDSTVSMEPEIELIVLDAPQDPHWDAETGIGTWTNVENSGVNGEVGYLYNLYRMDTDTPPGPEDEYILQSGMRGNGGIDEETGYYRTNISSELTENGYYFFEVCSMGDGITYADSPYVMSGSFHYTGADAPTLPAPENLQWAAAEEDSGRVFFATCSNLDDYIDTDSFNVTVYDENNEYVMNNIWTKAKILKFGHGGIRIRQEFISNPDGAYRFTISVISSRPNEYRSYMAPENPTDEDCSPWYYGYNRIN